MTLMNAVFNVSTLYDCNDIENLGSSQYKYESLWRQTVTGCKVLRLLQEMYNFNVTYVINSDKSNLTYEQTRFAAYPHPNDSSDIYTRPIALCTKTAKDAYPLFSILTWRFGFILRRVDNFGFEPFYSLPFSRSVWNCLYAMIFLCSFLFFGLSQWEQHVIGGKWESTITYEVFVLIAAHCQHYLPRKAVLFSRRTAYFTFFLFSYVIYSFYTSNLLSNLVNEDRNAIDFEELTESNVELALLEHTKLDLNTEFIQIKMKERWSYVKVLNVSAGLEAVRSSKTALLTDYVTLYPVLKRTFNPHELCALAEVDIYTNIKKYLFTSKNFSYKDEFKRGILRSKEAGILQRLLKTFDEKPLCRLIREVHSQFFYILNPLVMLFGAYVVAVIILFIEIYHFKRNRTWPYLE